MLRAASAFPGSTFSSAVSTWREKKGTVPKIKGMMAPFTPIAVPTIFLVKGIRKTRRITKGIERKRFIKRLRSVSVLDKI